MSYISVDKETCDKMKRLRTLSLLLAIFMLLSVIGIPARAADAPALRGQYIVGLEMTPSPAGVVGNAVPTIYGEPQDVSVPAGTTVGFSVIAAGSGTLSYQWQYMKPGTTAWVNVSADSGKTPVYSLRVDTRHDGYRYRCRVTSSGGFSYSRTAVLHIVDVPVIVTEPTDVSAAVGQSAGFSVTAAGSGTLSYQWQYSGDGGETWTNVASGGTSRTYTISSVAERHLGFLFRCVIAMAGGGSVTTNTVRLISAPTVTISPASKTVNAGTAVTFTSSVSGGVSPYTYRWQYRASSSGSWTNVSTNGTGPSYTLTTAARHNGYQYRCVVTDKNGQTGTSNIASLTVIVSSPTVTISPASLSVNQGAAAKFTSSVSGGTAPYTYQWQYRTSSSGSWTKVSSGGTGSSYTLTTAARHNGYQYRLIVTDKNGQTGTSNVAALTVIPVASLKVTISPTSLTVDAGAAASFKATASGGTAPYTYRWQYRTSSSGSWTNVSSGGTGATYTLTTAARHNGYQYHCIVTDSTGKTAASGTAALTVISPLKVTISPASLTVDAGATASFKATASGGTAPYTYRWQYRTSSSGSWTNVSSGGASATYTLTTAARHNGYQYHCIVTDGTGKTAASGTATLHVTTPAPVTLTVSISPASRSVTEGDTASFTASASGGTSPYTYRWQYRTSSSGSWTNVSSGGTSATYSLTAEARHNGYQYRCTATDKTGNTGTSGTATLYVTASTVKYRALLIGQEAFSPKCGRNRGDVILMRNMLNSVKGPTGGTYSITERYDLSATGVKNAISSAFSGADSDDVSLFFIATHGDSKSTGVYAGGLSCIASSYSEQWLDLIDLASYLNAVPGKVIVILESCGSGAAVYANSASRGAAPSDLYTFNQSVISVFSAMDPGITVSAGNAEAFSAFGEVTEAANTGEFRTSKYYVLTASAYQQESYGWEDDYHDPAYSFNAFTYDLTNGIGTSGSMPADSTANYGNNDGVTTLYELYKYIQKYGDTRPHTIDGETLYQNVQVYPANSSYSLFKR